MEIKDWIIIGLVVILALKLMEEPGSNTETWDWVDYRGNKRTIGVHRDVH